MLLSLSISEVGCHRLKKPAYSSEEHWQLMRVWRTDTSAGQHSAHCSAPWDTREHAQSTPDTIVRTPQSVSWSVFFTQSLPCSTLSQQPTKTSRFKVTKMVFRSKLLHDEMSSWWHNNWTQPTQYNNTKTHQWAADDNVKVGTHLWELSFSN